MNSELMRIKNRITQSGNQSPSHYYFRGTDHNAPSRFGGGNRRVGVGDLCKSLYDNRVVQQ